jgi:hypothetical protein
MNTASFLRQALLALVLAWGADGGDTVRAGDMSRPSPLPCQTVSIGAARPQAQRALAHQGGFLQDVVGNRSRLIQVSFIFIIIGIFILWKK